MTNKDKEFVIKDRHRAIFSLAFILVGGLLFCWSISLTKDDNRSNDDYVSFLMVSGMLTGCVGICALGDIGKPQEAVSIKEKDYTKELLDKLNLHLSVNETIKKYVTFVDIKAASIVSEQLYGIAAATNTRIIIYKIKLGGHKIKSLNYNKISAIEHEESLVFDSLEFSTSGEKLSIDKINKGSTTEFVAYVNSMLK